MDHQGPGKRGHSHRHRPEVYPVRGQGRSLRAAQARHQYRPVRGLINQVLENNLFQRDYVLQYTNAAFVVNKDFAFHDGLFSGYLADKRVYNPETWDYELDEQKKPVTDPTLNNPRCVFQLMKKHFGRYTPEMVEATTGVPRDQFLKLAALYGATGQPGRSGSILYALGATEHTTGVQNIRSYSILQILLGNMGMPGGGINALRGVNNVQGSTDMALLPHIVPGYMAIPNEAAHPTFKDYLDERDAQGQLLDQQAQVFRQPPQGLLGGCGPERERLRLRLSSQGGQGV